MYGKSFKITDEDLSPTEALCGGDADTAADKLEFEGLADIEIGKTASLGSSLPSSRYKFEK